jgi:hypothetical protein
MLHCISSVYYVTTPLYVSGVSAAHFQEVECMYVANGTCYTSELTVSGSGCNGTHSIPARSTESQLSSLTCTTGHIYTFYLRTIPARSVDS